MKFDKITEKDSNYDNLESMSSHELLININNEDKTIALAVEKTIPEIETVVDICAEKLQNNGRLFYIGAGTSGRLGVLDASELPPTFGVKHNKVIGIIAGGDTALRNAVEFAEDSKTQGWDDLQKHAVTSKDFVIGIAASGTTPYVVHAIKACNAHRISTACITANGNSPLSNEAKYPIVVNVGPEFVTGSSRMKSGTAQKLILNMISTATMIKLGHVKGNKMVDMQLSNRKLVERGAKIISDELHIDIKNAEQLLKQYGSVRAAIKHYNSNEK